MSMLVCIRVILKTVFLVEHDGTTYCYALRGQHTKTISVGTRRVEHPELRIGKVHTKTNKDWHLKFSQHVPFFTIPAQTFEIKGGRPFNLRLGVAEPRSRFWSALFGLWPKLLHYHPPEGSLEDETTGKDLMLQTHWKNVTLRQTSLGESRNQELQNNRNIHFQFFWVKNWLDFLGT